MEISREETVLQATKIIELIDELEAENCTDYAVLAMYINSVRSWADTGGIEIIEIILSTTVTEIVAGTASVGIMVQALETARDIASEELIEGGAR